jgi:DNA ligase-1
MLDFLLPTDPNSSPEFVSFEFLSRTGKPFHSLDRLAEQLRLIVGFPRLREWLERDPEGIEPMAEGEMKRLVLDGEICVMRPRPASEVERNLKRHDDGTGAAAIWTADDGLVEDFPATVSEVRSTKHTIEHPAYFLFDVLPWAEVQAKRSLPAPLGKTFSERVEDMKEVSDWLNGELENKGIQEKFIRRLVQWEVKGMDDMEGMVGRAAEEGWEGLIFRADRPYKGRRSSVLFPPRRPLLIPLTARTSANSSIGRTQSTQSPG